MFFKNVQGLDDLKSQYKKLARVHHPDCGGETQNMQTLNNEFDAFLYCIKKVKKPPKNSQMNFILPMVGKVQDITII